jgi:hypothetical protein
MQGRSFGTNVLEGVLISLLGKGVDEAQPEDYNGLLDRLQLKPRIVYLQEEKEPIGDPLSLAK